MHSFQQPRKLFITQNQHLVENQAFQQPCTIPFTDAQLSATVHNIVYISATRSSIKKNYTGQNNLHKHSLHACALFHVCYRDRTSCLPAHCVKDYPCSSARCGKPWVFLPARCGKAWLFLYLTLLSIYNRGLSLYR